MDQRGKNQAMVKIANQGLIIKEIRSHRQLSRSDLAKLLCLSNPSVSKHVDDLIAKGLVVETGSIATDVGRRPIMLEFNSRHGCVAAIDMSSTDARLCIADLSGNKLEYSRIEGGQIITRDTLRRVIHNLRDMLNSVRGRCGSLVGICIGLPAIIDPDTGLIGWSARVEDYKGLDLRAMFEAEFKAPTLVKRDINLAVVGEQMFGAGGGVSSMLYYSIDAGVGLSAVIDGKLYEGTRGVACDVGVVLHNADVVMNAPLPEDGSYICYSIGRRIKIYTVLSEIRELLESGRSSVLRDWISTTAELTFDDVVRAYGMSDPLVCDVIGQLAKRVAIAFSNAGSYFDVELIILGGMMAKLGNKFLDEIKALYDLLPGYGKSELKVSKLSESAVIFGAIENATQLAIDKIISEE